MKENKELVDLGAGFCANLTQFPHMVNMSGPTLKCLLRRGCTWSSKAERPLLPIESLGVHLFPTRKGDMEGTGVPWPFDNELEKLQDVDAQSLAGNGMVLSVIGCVILCLNAFLERKETPVLDGEVVNIDSQDP